MSTALLSVISVILLFAQFISAFKKCYSPDGSIADSRFLPCIGFENVDSMCCRLNDTSPDVCQSNGLCYWPEKDKYYRNYCTSKSFDSPYCVSKTICDAASGGSSSLGSQVILCPGGSANTFCCGETNDCCTEEKEFTLKQTLITFDSNATAAANSTASLKTSDTKSSTKIAIGAGVGVPLGILAIVMLGAGFWWGRRKTREKYEALRQIQPHTAINLEADSDPLGELDSTARPKGPFELPQR